MLIEPWLPRAAARRPACVALEIDGVTTSYAELLERAEQAAHTLREEGVRPGTSVGLVLEPGLSFVVTLHACLLAGGVAVPIDPRLTPAERRVRLNETEVIVGEGHGAVKRRDSSKPSKFAIFRPSPDDVALVVHTSGTTGAPRPVELTHGNVQASAMASAAALGLDGEERWLCPLPLAHVGGLMVLLRSAIYASCAVLAPPPFVAERIATLLSGDVTVASLVPTMLKRVLDLSPQRPRKLRTILLGGAPADRTLLERAAAAGYPVRQTYGMTETCSQVTVSEPGDLDTAGVALPGVSLSVEADGGLVVEGDIVAGGGPLVTGDIGRLDERGRLIVLGRRDDLIITGGDNVAPTEVENVLLGHPDVADAAVIARPDREWGEAVTALVVPRAGAETDADGLRRFCSERLARFKVPKSFETVPALPRNAAGKLLRRELS
ncbi:MAG: AMP-binding protein [Actinomycetota bacterium]|nr:AMP-binding protein [Actinomycetota bacterium]